MSCLTMPHNSNDSGCGGGQNSDTCDYVICVLVLDYHHPPCLSQPLPLSQLQSLISGSVELSKGDNEETEGAEENETHNAIS